MQRPTSITVFGIIHIVIGALGMCCMSLALFGTIMPNDGSTPEFLGNDPTMRLIEENAAYRAYMIGSCTLSVLVSLLLIVAGIGLLTSQAWGRWMSIGYGFYGILSGIVAIIINIIFVAPAAAQQAQQQGTLTPGSSDAAAQQIGMQVGSVCAGIAVMIYPILVLIFMNRAVVVDFFRGNHRVDDSDTWNPNAPL